MSQLKIFKNAVLMFLVLTIVTGILYPLFIYVFAHLFFPFEANGSLISVNNKIIASKIIGQNFTQDKYLWSRPSETDSYPYNPLSSGSSNFALTNSKLLDEIVLNVNKLQTFNKEDKIPIDIVTPSASGLDPEISLEGAYYQIYRIAKVRKISLEKVKKIIDKNVVDSYFSLFVKPRVNVLMVNLNLDGIQYKRVLR